MSVTEHLSFGQTDDFSNENISIQLQIDIRKNN